METEVGVPLDYNEKLMERGKIEFENHTTPIEDVTHTMEHPQMFYPPQHMFYPPPPMHEKPDFFASLDKTAYIIAFITFILGYFMGKSVHPVIIRPG